MIIIFVEFIDQLIDYPINCASLKSYVVSWWDVFYKYLHYNYVFVENKINISSFFFFK